MIRRAPPAAAAAASGLHTAGMMATLDTFQHRERARFVDELACADDDALRAVLLAEVRARVAPFGGPPPSWRLSEAVDACQRRGFAAWVADELRAAGLDSPAG